MRQEQLPESEIPHLHRADLEQYRLRHEWFPSRKIEEYFKADEIKGIPGKAPYRFLIVADKFQTGYDDPPGNPRVRTLPRPIPAVGVRGSSRPTMARSPNRRPSYAHFDLESPAFACYATRIGMANNPG